MQPGSRRIHAFRLQHKKMTIISALKALTVPSSTVAYGSIKLHTTVHSKTDQRWLPEIMPTKGPQGTPDRKQSHCSGTRLIRTAKIG